MLQALAFLQNVWAALSLVSAVGSIAGLALLAAAILVLPGPFKRAALAVGVVLLILSSTYQVAHLAGAERARAVAERRAEAAELERLKRSVEINRRDAERAARAIASAQSDLKKLKELNDALSRDAERNRRCTTRDDARRLRDL